MNFSQDVEHELTEKVEVLVYCPLTIRQRLLYQGLKQNIRMEELMAGKENQPSVFHLLLKGTVS